MFQELETLPADPILGLNQTFQQDTNPNKINLSVGVYQNAAGQTPIFAAVKKAEQQLIDAQQTKTYAPQAGDRCYDARGLWRFENGRWDAGSQWF